MMTPASSLSRNGEGLYYMSKTSLGLVLASLLVSGSAFADTFQFLSGGSTIWNNIYVNPYTASDTTPGHGSKVLTVYCDDWNTEFSGNPQWTANVYGLTLANLSHFRYGNTTLNYNVTLAGNQLSAALSAAPAPFQRYLEAAWLDEQWEKELQNNPSTDTQIKLAAAAWTLFVDEGHVGDLVGRINSSGYAPAVFNYLQAAENAVTAGYTAAGWDVIVPVDSSIPMQEFLVHTPEPSAVILLGTVAGFLGLKKLRRKRRA